MTIEDKSDIDFWNRELEGIDLELPAIIDEDPIEQAFQNKMRHIKESDETQHLLLLGMLNTWADWTNIRGGEKCKLWDIIIWQIEYMTRRKDMTPSQFIDYVFRPEQITGRYDSREIIIRFLI